MERNKKIIQTSVLGIIVNLVLVAFKAFVGLFSGSVAVILDAANNLSDALSSVITIIGTTLSAKAPDKKHPYGHGRVEYITAAIIAAIVLVTGALSLKESIEKIINPTKAEYNAAAIVIIIAAIAAKIVIGLYYKATGKKLNANVLIASGSDALSDAFLSGGTLIAAVVSLIWNITIEGWIGAVISIFIIRAGVMIIKETFDSIIGTRADPELTEKLKERLCGYENVLGCYDLALHNYGPDQIIGSAHIEVPDDMTADKIHKLTRKISADIYMEFGIILTVGIYASNNSEKAAEIKDALMEIAKDCPGLLQVHGFYLDEESKTVTFDLVTDFKADAKAINDKITGEIKSKYPDHEFYVVLDSDYSD